SPCTPVRLRRDEAPSWNRSSPAWLVIVSAPSRRTPRAALGAWGCGGGNLCGAGACTCRSSLGRQLSCAFGGVLGSPIKSPSSGVPLRAAVVDPAQAFVGPRRFIRSSLSGLLRDSGISGGRSSRLPLT